MAQQQIQIAETIRAMKLAMRRRPDDSDSDDSIRVHTNRGNKLKRKSRNVQQSRLDDSGGVSYKKVRLADPSVYVPGTHKPDEIEQKVTHAGYVRHVISTNPPLFDEDGDPYSPNSSDNEYDRFAEPADDNPFGEVRLDLLLRPLTAAAELPNHPGLRTAYKSKAITEMAEDALGRLRRERATLWKAKRLLQRFRGDADWVPVATFETPHDEVLLDGEGGVIDRSTVPSITTEQPPLELVSSVEQATEIGTGTARLDGESGRVVAGNEAGAMEGVDVADAAAWSAARDGGTLPGIPTGLPGPPGEHASNPTLADLAERETASETASTNTHAMTTRARARSPAEPSDRTPSPSPSDSASVPVVNPWFLSPMSALADRDLGLPAKEAEETRRLLLLYVQKQEQVVRSLDSLYMGLQKTDRLRKFVYDSCKAEAHLVPDGKGNVSTEMSDGEDWYDVADWNLQPWELKEGKLEKGKDEVEDVEEEGRRGPRRRRVNRM